MPINTQSPVYKAVVNFIAFLILGAVFVYDRMWEEVAEHKISSILFMILVLYYLFRGIYFCMKLKRK